MLVPSKFAEPLVGSSSALIIFSNVVFPESLGPTSPVHPVLFPD